MFRRLLDKINRFMYGRYGADPLFYALLILFLALNLLGNLFRLPVLWLLSYAPAIWALVRYYSKNIYKRREENRRFLAIGDKVKSAFRLLRDRFRDRKVCRYRKCKHCRAILRLPIRRGKHSVKCPRCGKSFDVHIWF